MRRLLSWQLSILLLAGMAAGAQVPIATPSGAGEAPTTPSTSTPQVTVTAPRVDGTLPALPPDEFTNCVQQSPQGSDPKTIDYIQAEICEHQLNYEKHIVIEACINRSGNTALPRVIQACTESLDHKIFEGNARFFLFANRAAAYSAQGDKQHALDDYTEAVKLAPNNAELHYNRGVFYAAQNDGNAALQDFDTALGINPKLVPALHRRARIYQTQGNLSGALADYSQAIALQPKTAALWSERGSVFLMQGEFRNAVEDEGQAILLDPKLARAYYFRGVAFAGLDDSQNARSDIATAVRLDPSLKRYVKTKE
ncbi:MAG: tetratricopeptide repeat protein [Steroidobacteraceae bacterium]